MKYVVVGQSGQVSRALSRKLEGREVLFTSSSGGNGSVPLDLGREDSIREAFGSIGQRLGKGPVEVFLAGAMTHVDRCEQEKDRCRQVNEVGPGLVAQECARLGYGLTYFSTEYVYGQAEYEGGPVGPFSEADAPSPSSWYGECKLRAEEAVAKVFGRDGALIARTTMVFSWDPKGMNFLMQYLRQLNPETRVPSFRIPVDQISTPAYAPWLAEAVIRLRERGVGGIFNLVGSDLLSRREIVERVAEDFGFGKEEAHRAFRFVKTAELGQAARRPLTAGLTMAKAKAHGIEAWSLDQAFADIKKLRDQEER
jgi:dTDP-4-dehydrorhamnose reductase